MRLSELMDLDTLQFMIAQGYVRTQRHPELPLVIFNYAEITAYERAWNHVTKTCRGLIVRVDSDDLDGEVVARPFEKFMNYGEPGSPVIHLDAGVEVTDKLDGCFPRGTALNLWGGGTVTIDNVVRQQLPVTLVGMDARGQLVPAVVTGWHDNGRKDHWLDIEIDSNVSRAAGNGRGRKTNRLRVTVNHQVFVNGAYASACDVVPGDVMVTQTWQPSASVLRLVRASLLGDGCLVYSATSSGQAKYQEGHCEKQEDYVLALRKALGDCGAHRSDTVSGFGSRMVWAGSREYRALGVMRAEWYPEGVKRVPEDLTWLDDFAVAKWFMDDGSRQRFAKQADRIVFSTDSFSREDIVRLGDRLTEMYGVSYHIVGNGRASSGLVLVINSGRKQQIRRMWEAIAPHVHPSFHYKLPLEYRAVPYVELEIGRELVAPRETRVLSVAPVAPTLQNFPSGRTGYDVTTSTHNYLARGVLVHNSLGILYHIGNGEYAIATRGSFASEQALHATKVWQDRYASKFVPSPGVTYLFEIVYPQNRIVCDYGSTDDLFLLGSIDTASGRSYGPDETDLFGDWPGPCARTFSYSTLAAALEAPPRAGAEGLVVRRWHSEDRIKLKQADYVALHRIITGCTARRLWEYLAVNACLHLSEGTSFLVRRLRMAPDRIAEVMVVGPEWLETFQKGTPEEFRDWVTDRVGEFDQLYVDRVEQLTRSFMSTLDAAGLDYTIIGNPSREEAKRFSATALGCPDFNLWMTLLRGQEIETGVWRELRPEHELPFRAVDESIA